MPSRDGHLGGVAHFERPAMITVDHDVVRATTDLDSDRLVRELESCRNPQSPYCVSRSAVVSGLIMETLPSARQQCYGTRWSRRANGLPSVFTRRPDRRAVHTPRYPLEPAIKIRRSRYKSRSRGATNTRPHQRPVAQSTTTMTAIQTASSSRIPSDDLRWRRSQLIVPHATRQLAYGILTETRGAEVTRRRLSRHLSSDYSAAEHGDQRTGLSPSSWRSRARDGRSGALGYPRTRISESRSSTSDRGAPLRWDQVAVGSRPAGIAGG